MLRERRDELKRQIKKIMQGQGLDLVAVSGDYEDVDYLKRTDWRIDQILTAIREAAEEGMPENPYMTEFAYQCSLDAGMPLGNKVVNDAAYVAYAELNKTS